MQVVVGYCAVNIHLQDGRTIHVQAPQYRLNVVISSGVLRIVDDLAEGRMTTDQAIEQMQALQKFLSFAWLWTSLLCFGLAASALVGISAGKLDLPVGYWK